MPEKCDRCGDEFRCELLEVWGHDFMLDTCCEWVHERFTALADRDDWKELFWEGGGIRIRQVYEDWFINSLKVDYGLIECNVTLAEAKQFINEWHRHNKPPVGWRWGHAVSNGGLLIAVAMIGRPVARKIDHKQVVEVNRLCVHPDLDAALVWNAASQLYGAAAREAKRRGFSKIITYTLESEEGVGLKAAGWTAEATTRGGTWNRPSRERQDSAPTCRKIRWARML